MTTSSGPRSYEYVVVGAGPMGASAAKYLATENGRVALVAPGDQTSGHHRFSSHADVSRIARALDADPVWATLGRRSLARYRDVERTSGVPFFSQVGSLLVLSDLSGQESEYVAGAEAVFARVGVPHERLDRAALRQRFGYVDFGEGAVGLLESGAGFIDPNRFIEAQIAQGQQHGLDVFHVPMRSIDPNGPSSVVHLADGTRIHARRVLLALGPYSRFDAACPVADQLTVYGRTIIHLEVPMEFLEQTKDMPTMRVRGPEHGFYVVPPLRYPDGRWYLKIGGGPRTENLDSLAELEQWCRGDGHAAVAELLLAKARTLLPGLAPLTVRRQACVITVPDGGYPYITEGGGIGIVTGGNGAGAKSGDELGRLAAGMISGRRDWADGYGGNPFEPVRFNATGAGRA